MANEKTGNIGPGDKKLERKRAQIVGEFRMIPILIYGRLDEDEGVFLEELLLKGQIDIDLRCFKLSSDTTRRIMPVLPEIMKTMNEENCEMKFSLIEGKTQDDLKYTGVRIVI